MRRLLAHRHLAAVLCALVLSLKLLLPTGYMVASEHGRAGLVACSGMAKPAVHGQLPDHGQPKDHGKVEAPCAFAGVSAPALNTIDPLQLAEPVAVLVALGLAWRTSPALAVSARLRPPLRAPPVL